METEEMMALDSKQQQVGFGDYVAVQAAQLDEVTKISTIVRIVKLSETPKGVFAVGGYVDLVGGGRIAKVKVDIATSTLVMRSNGTPVL
jgi:hypothetical protein